MNMKKSEKKMIDYPACHYEYLLPSWENQLDELLLEFCCRNEIKREDLLEFLKKIIKELEYVSDMD